MTKRLSKQHKRSRKKILHLKTMTYQMKRSKERRKKGPGKSYRIRSKRIQINLI